MNAPGPAAWIDANQRLMVAEIARLKQRLGDGGDTELLDAAVEAAQVAMPAPAAIDHLAQCFGLSAFERDVLLLCAGTELDAEFAAKCASIAGQSSRPGTTFGLALAALSGPHWSALAPVRPLRRWRFVEIDEAAGPARARLRIDERILHYLTGVNYIDSRLRSLLRPVSQPILISDAHRGICAAVCSAVETSTGPSGAAVWLSGDDLPAQTDVAAEVAAALGLSLHVLRGDHVPAGHAEREALATLWEREAILLGSALLVGCGTDALPETAARLVDELHGLVFISAGQPHALERHTHRFVINKPDPTEQKRLWLHALGAGAARLNGALDCVASQFQLSARTIHAESPYLAPRLAASDQPDRILWSVCRAVTGSKLDELAQHVHASAGWDDLILPDAQKSTLRLIGAHVRNRFEVYREWGFAGRGERGLGISALFAGESGTGKTMAAEVLARDLQLDLYRIDLSAVVSKYIGETEKNLRRLFDAAEDGGAILLFDEADALFGKRSEVKDSHDRYANIEVSYLLQRMESYRGLAILTTNHKDALDSAFQRRLRFVVRFPFPDQAHRESIWRAVFPVGAPLEGIDYAKLARLNVAGGTIRNIALSAAFLAAESGAPISMAHLLRGAHLEAAKREKPYADAETRGWI